MKKKTKVTDRVKPTVPSVPSVQPTARPEGLRRVMIMISEPDLDLLRAEGVNGVAVTAYLSKKPKGALTDEQREKRKSYLERPEVKKKMKAYRALRAKRIREAAKLARDGAAKQ